MEGSVKEKKITMVFNKITGVKEHLRKCLEQAHSINSKLFGAVKEAEPAKIAPKDLNEPLLSFFDELSAALEELNGRAINVKMELEDINQNL